MTIEARLSGILAGHKTVKIATTGGGVSPWIATAFFVEKGLFELHLLLEKGSTTYKALRHHPKVAVLIDTGSPMAPFAQGEGTAGLARGATVGYREALTHKSPEAAALFNAPNLVPVKIRLARWWVTDAPAGWLTARELVAPPPPGRVWTPKKDEPQPRELLEHDHARLEILFDALMEAFHADAREDVRKIWTELEETLLTHMDTEERWVLPAFARVDPMEAAELLEEHGTIRARLSDLGNGVELHAIPEGVAAAFIGALRTHARRESALFYRWVQGRPEPARERLL